ncbi:MAG: efflux RND transporter periplasmic adaptor subunit [Pseudomonadota bacterium]
MILSRFVLVASLSMGLQAVAPLIGGPAAAQDADSTTQADPADLAPSGVPLPVPSVKLLTPEAATGQQVRTFFGRIAARETVDLSCEVGGHLTEFPVIEGTRVAEGDLLARLDLGPFERSVEQAELALDQADRTVERTSSLMERNVASEVQTQDAATERDIADVGLRDAQAALVDATLLAPFDGLVASRLTPQFSNVTEGQAILRLHDMSEVRVEIDVPERLFRIGDGTDIAFEGVLPQLTDPVPLELAEFDAQTGTVGQTFRVSLRLPPLDVATLIPGASMTVRAVLDTPEADGVPLPATAILAGADRATAVMLYEPADGDTGRVRRLPVEVRSSSGTDLLVAGLPEGAQVVAVGGHLLSDGDSVRPWRGLSVEE